MSRMMKRIIVAIITMFISVAMMPLHVNKIYAETTVSYTEMGCNAYEVSNANADGSFTVIDCKGNFKDALSLMKSSGENAVVRHAASKSPMKIIAMNSGIAATYSFRVASGSSVATTATIWQYATSVANEKTTYITSHREVAYFDTYSFNESSGDGYVHINSSGFDGYMRLIQVDLIPSIFIENNVRTLLGGNTAVANYEQPFYVYTKRAYFTVEQNGKYKELVYHFHSQWASQKDYQPASYSYALGPAADWMNVNDRYYSYDYVHYFSDKNYTDLKGTYYNYYMYLPLRSQTNISAEQMENYLSSKGYNSSNSKMVGNANVFIEGQNQYGVNALLVFAMGCLESGYGTSNIAMTKNNLFGWAAVDSDPNDATAYPSISSAILQHMNRNLRGYMDVMDARFFGSHIGNNGSGFNVKYASDPYWGLKISSIAYEIDKFANGNNGNLSDYNYYRIGILNNNVNIKKTADSSSQTLYNSAYGATYQKDFTVIVNEGSGTWLQIPSTNAINSSGALIRNGDPVQEYNWQTSLGYVMASECSLIYNSRYTESVLPKPGMIQSEMLAQDIVNETSSLAWSNSILSIKGYAYQPGFSVGNYNNISHVLVLTDNSGNKTRFNLEHISTAKAITSVKGLDYTKSGYSSSSINLSSLKVGTYNVSMEVTMKNGNIVLTKEILLNASKLPSDMVIGNDTYKISNASGSLQITKSRKTVEVKRAVVSSLQELNWTSDNRVYIKGIGYVQGIDNTKQNKIEKKLLILNADNNEIVKTIALNNIYDSLVMGDGYDYECAWYDGTFDVSDLPLGEYKFTLQINFDGKTYETVLTSINKKFELDVKELSVENETYKYKFNENPVYSYRLELVIGKNYIHEISPTALISRMKPVLVVNDISISRENGKNMLNLDGMSFIWYVRFSNKDKISYDLILENLNTGKVYESFLSQQACSVDYTSLYGLKYDVNSACFAGSTDLNELESGDYELYLKINSQNDKKVYVDSIKLYSLYSNFKEQNISDDKGEYGLAIRGYNNRYHLSISNVANIAEIEETSIDELETELTEEDSNQDIEE